MTPVEILEAARTLADQLTDDIRLARTRETHVLATIRANSARALANGLVAEETEHFVEHP
jgi:hypothetical protein